MSEPALSPCAALVRRGDPDRFLSAMTAPPERRERLFALYAFNLEVARIGPMVSEPMLGLIRLQWWRETVEMAREGRRRAHEVAGPMAETIAAADLPAEPFERLLTARALDLEPAPFPDRAALDGYLRDTGGALLTLAARALAGVAAPAEEAGYAFAAAAWLRAAPALSAAGRRPLPDPAPETARALARDALAALRRARREGVPRAAAAAFRAGWRAEPTLRAALGAGYSVTEGPAEPALLRSRAALLWRAALGGW